MPTLVNVTNPSVNEIVVSSSYLQGVGSVNRLGASQIEHTSATNALTGDIFFKFYRCVDSSGSKVYSALDVSSAISNATVENRFLTMLLPQYYNDSILVNDIGGSYVDIAERLSGVVTPTTPLSSTLSMPSSSSNFVEFVGMGLSSWVGANYINGGSSGRSTSVWGTRVGQVHVTNIDPTVSPVNAIYDNSDSGAWQFSADFNTDGIIVYTNLAGSAFVSSGLSCWSQLLCVWPILASTLNAEFACIFNNLDQSFLKDGLGYFDRSGRIDTYFGWAGNYLQSIFNDWGIPVVSPVWSLSDLALAAYVTYPGIGESAQENFGSVTDPSKAWRFVGPVASNNVSDANEKAARSLFPVLWANECRRGNVDSIFSAIPSFEQTTVALGYAQPSDYFASCLSGTSEGYNAHIYKYVLNDSFDITTPTSTRSYINTTSVPWSTKLSAQPSLQNCFVDPASSDPRYFPAAHDDFYGTVASTYGAALKARIEDGTLITVDPMTSGQSSRIRNWVYTP